MIVLFIAQSLAPSSCADADPERITTGTNADTATIHAAIQYFLCLDILPPSCQGFHFGPGTVTVYTLASPNSTCFRAELCTSPPPPKRHCRTLPSYILPVRPVPSEPVSAERQCRTTSGRVPPRQEYATQLTAGVSYCAVSSRERRVHRAEVVSASPLSARGRQLLRMDAPPRGNTDLRGSASALVGTVWVKVAARRGPAKSAARPAPQGWLNVAVAHPPLPAGITDRQWTVLGNFDRLDRLRFNGLRVSRRRIPRVWFIVLTGCRIRCDFSTWIGLCGGRSAPRGAYRER